MAPTNGTGKTDRRNSTVSLQLAHRGHSGPLKWLQRTRCCSAVCSKRLKVNSITRRGDETVKRDWYAALMSPILYVFHAGCNLSFLDHS